MSIVKTIIPISPETPGLALWNTKIVALAGADLYAWYKHEETSGTVATDSSGNGRNANYSGMLLNQTGAFTGSKAVNMNNAGVTNAFAFPMTGALAQASATTFGFWMACYLDPGASTFTFFNWGSSAPNQLVVSWNKTSGVNASWGGVTISGPSSGLASGSSPITWHFVVFVTNPSGNIKLYVNGVLVAQATGSVMPLGTFTGFIRRYQLDESFIITKELTATEIADLYATRA
jgi:hypothetical protein